jgi:hypothetical protein
MKAKPVVTKIRVSKIDNFHFKLSIDAVIVKQKRHRQWIIIVNGNCLAYGTTPEEAIKNLGYEGNLRYLPNIKKNVAKKNQLKVDKVV